MPDATTVRRVELLHGLYHDSVTLMAASRTLGDLPGVEAAFVAMATDLNLGLLGDMGFHPPHGAGPNDLLVALAATGEDALAGARGALEATLVRARGGDGAALDGALPPPRTLGAAARRAGADLALISVPGPFVFPDAMEALAAGLNVLVFSDNVPVAQEVALKAEAARRGLLVMGPDCGTAIVGGIGLGFANVVRPGPVGIVAASGTGAQQICCLLDEAGVGVRHVLGVGGRDLSAVVGGASTLAALAALEADPGVELIVVVSKPPSPEVAARVREAAAACATPVVTAFVAPGEPDLTAATRTALAQLGHEAPVPRSWPAVEPRDVGGWGVGGRDGGGRGVNRQIRGLFAGGTLCAEAAAIVGRDHVLVDLGADAYTRGRPHPMIDQRSRLARITAEAADPGAGVLLLDVVLGHGAHPDPAAELASALRAAGRVAQDNGRDLPIVVSLCGTEGDPQGLERQAEALLASGASVHRSNAAAAAEAGALAGGTHE